MSYGLQIMDGAGGMVLDTDDYTFRYIGTYTFQNNSTADVVLNIDGIAAGTHFAIVNTGFAVVSTNQVTIKPQFGSGTFTNSFDLFRI